jgi:hypothetical protein
LSAFWLLVAEQRNINCVICKKKYQYCVALQLFEIPLYEFLQILRCSATLTTIFKQKTLFFGAINLM